MTKRPYAREHGTARGYDQHQTRGEVPCGACLNGNAVDVQKRRNRGRCARGLGWPLEARRG